MIGTRTKSAFFLALSLALATHAIDARADELESEGARLFREGRALMLDGRFADACPKLDASQRLEPRTGTLLNLAACNERLGKVASAWIEYQISLTAARAEGHAERADLAQRRIEVLEPRVPWLTIDVREPLRSVPGLVVSLDGAGIRQAAFGKEMPVDPGSHVVVASAPDRSAFEATVDLHESERRVVTVGTLDTSLPPPKPATLIVDGGDKTAPPAPKEAEATRIVLEIGPMIGFMSVTGRNTTSSGGLAIRPSGAASDAPTSNCGPSQCYIDASNGGMFLGITAFAGYAFTDAVHGGVRFIGGARASQGGGDLLAGGPAVSYHVGGPVRVGASLLLGGAIVVGPSTATVPSGYTLANDPPSSTRGSLEIGGGAGAELDWELAKIGNGGLEFAMTPLFLVGSHGNAWGIPLGLTYRSR